MGRCDLAEGANARQQLGKQNASEPRWVCSVIAASVLREEQAKRRRGAIWTSAHTYDGENYHDIKRR